MKLLAPLVRTKSQDRMSFADYLALTASYTHGGNSYSLPVQTTMSGQKTEPIGNSFEGYVLGGLYGNSVIFGLVSVRVRVFAEARFQFQQLRNGRPGDLFGTPDLEVLEHPWPGGTTGDLLATMLLHADFAGNSYVVRSGSELVPLRPDWVDIIIGDRADGAGIRKLGYAYYKGGRTKGARLVTYLAGQVGHFAPHPDPLAAFRGMSWLTPVIREIQADTTMTEHKIRFLENAATPNLAVSLKELTTVDQFNDFVDAMDESHKGWQNAYKTLYLGAGADVQVIGADMAQLDFKVTQGAGETRMAQAAGVPATVANIAEGLQGSSLNAGNYGQARRQFADTTMAHLWRNVAGSLETLVPAPPSSRLWVDRRDISFLREDEKDAAEIQQMRASTIRTLTDGGYTPDSVIKAVEADDMGLLAHTGLLPVQLQPPGSSNEPEPPALPPGATRSERFGPEQSTVNFYPPTVNAYISPSPAPDVHVDVAAPTVNVAAPDVQVTNDVPVPSVTVSPPEVPSVTVDMPAPRTRRVEYDAAGRPVRLVEE